MFEKIWWLTTIFVSSFHHVHFTILVPNPLIGSLYLFLSSKKKHLPQCVREQID